jgi:hypothetical protein
MRHAQVGLGEWLQPAPGDRGIPGGHSALHEAQVDRAHHLLMRLRQFQERAMPQTDVPTVSASPQLRVKSQLIEKRDQPRDGLPRRTAGGVLAAACGTGQQLTQLAARAGRSHGRFWPARDAPHEDLSQELVTPRTGPVHLSHRAEQLRRPSRPAVVRRDLLGLAAGDQAEQVEPDGVRVHGQLVRDRRSSLTAAGTSQVFAFMGPAGLPPAARG